MTATNHALTGALLGLAIGNPALAIPVAFLSHFALDAIPHYDPPGNENQRISAKRFKTQILVDASLCGVLVLCLALTHPRHWLTAALSAFAAASPDFMWIPKFIQTQRTGKTPPNKNLVLKFHSWIQWRTGPKLVWVEALWFATAFSVLVTQL